ncbi:hypothetical protein AQUCO_00300473v1 [Aquilegia coerulea]|uniref:Uncharacterized protein n=1 Tax=Aquilegia coerulea TaxID=218851 RepID=A0A2G5EYY2_AQUCA|nr:hypothetical protein AQUCO_00300473v1 [Aquilegia coerulea]
MWTGSKGRFRHWRENILEAEAARNECEVKTWGLDATLRQIFKELETPSVECNQAITSPCISMAVFTSRDISFVHCLAPYWPSSVLNFNFVQLVIVYMLFILLFDHCLQVYNGDKATNQQSQDNNSRVEEKTNCLTEVQSQDKSRLSLMKKELKSYISMCYTEANQITEVLNERHISWALWKEKQKFF